MSIHLNHNDDMIRFLDIHYSTMPTNHIYWCSTATTSSRLCSKWSRGAAVPNNEPLDTSVEATRPSLATANQQRKIKLAATEAHAASRSLSQPPVEVEPEPRNPMPEKN